MNTLVHIPVSLGELYDKISILEIKAEKIKDKEKLIHINKELTHLSEIAKKYPIASDLYKSLIYINFNLWLTEDKIREKEAKGEFDDNFIQLARDVYNNNDKRSEIKREINIKYNSKIIEVKSYENYK